MTDGRVDRLARRLASSDRNGPSSRTVTPPDTAEAMLDGVARALVAPISRRRAVVAIGGAVVAGSTLRPGWASADARVCSGATPKKCQGSGGQSVCVSADSPCCSNELCGGACRPGQVCRPGDGDHNAHCEDTAAACRQYPGQPVFCEVKGNQTGSVTCGQNPSIPGQSGYYCCPPHHTCSPDPKVTECVCKTTCGRHHECCAPDEFCESHLLGDRCRKKCKDPKDHHCSGSDQCCPPLRECDKNNQCVCTEGDTCGIKCCKPGDVCLGGSHCGKPAPVPEKGPLDNLFDFWGNLLGETHGASGGGKKSALLARAASSPVDAALLALAAVDAQCAAAGIAFTDLHVDRSYRRKVVAAKPAPAKLQPGPGLDARAASALNALIAAEAKAFALLAASAKSLARARGAARKNDALLTRRQVRAAAAFAAQAAKALRRAAPLRAKAANALTATGTSEVTVSAGDLIALQAAVRTGGVPADLAAALKRLGVAGDDLKRVRKALLAQPSSGGMLIAPLADTQRTQLLQALAAQLARYAKKARRNPIVRTRGEPLRIPGSPARRGASARRL